MNHHLRLIPAIAALASSVPSASAAKIKNMANPDFAKGETIPTGATHDWNLVATGARGWIYSDKLATSDARQIYVTNIDRLPD